MNLKRNLKSKTGFAGVEALVILVILAVCAGAIYLWRVGQTRQKNSATTEQTTQGHSSTTAVPTIEPLAPDSSDEEINQSATALNSLNLEINSLDTVDQDLDLPQVDLSGGLEN